MDEASREEWLSTLRKGSSTIYAKVQEQTPSDISIYTFLSILEKARNYSDLIKRSELFMSERAFYLFYKVPEHQLLNDVITCPKESWERELITLRLSLGAMPL